MQSPTPPAPDRSRLLLAGLLGLALAASLWGLTRFPPPWAAEKARAALEAAKQGDKAPPVEACIDLALWPALAAAAVILAALLATVRFWGGRVTGLAGSLRLVRLSNPTLLALLVATALGAALRGPRLSHSFWNDEETTMQDYSWGEWRESKDGTWKFRPVSWTDTVFYNRGGSNHVLNSILTRLTLDATGDPKSGRFTEASARAVPYAASLVTIFLLGWLLARAGLPPAGAVTAAFLLALHPWHLRYSVEIRGYSVMLAAMLGSLACLLQALSSGRRRWWAGFALGQSAYLLAFSGSVYFAAAVDLAALVGCFLLARNRAAASGDSATTDDAPRPWPQVIRLLAWCALSAVPVLVIMAPSVPQLSFYLTEGKRMIAFQPNWGWEKDFFTHWMSGLPPTDPAPGESRGLGFHDLRGHLVLAALGAAALLGLVGLLVRRGTPALRFLAAVFVAAPVLSYAHNRLADNPTMPWYLQFALFALAAGLAALIAGKSRWTQAASGAALVLLFGISVAPSLLRHVTVPRQPLRETAVALRGKAPTSATKGDTQAITASFGVSGKRLRSYDPRLEVLKAPDDLEALLQKARQEKRHLRVAFCGRRLALGSPDFPILIINRIEDPASGFRHLADVSGMEELFSYHVWEWDGAKDGGK